MNELAFRRGASEPGYGDGEHAGGDLLAPHRVTPVTKRWRVVALMTMVLAHGGDEHLAQGPELPAPHDRPCREPRGEQGRHRENPGAHKRARAEASDPAGRGGAGHERERRRLQQRVEHAQPVAVDPDQVALPGDPHGPDALAHALG